MSFTIPCSIYPDEVLVIQTVRSNTLAMIHIDTPDATASNVQCAVLLDKEGLASLIYELQMLSKQLVD